MKVFTLEWSYASAVSGVYKTEEEANEAARKIQEMFPDKRIYAHPLVEEWDLE